MLKVCARFQVTPERRFYDLVSRMTKHLPGDLTPFIRKNTTPFKAANRALRVEPIRPRVLQRFIGNSGASLSAR
jgi:hypothetical protein